MATRDQKRTTGRDPAGPLTHPMRRRILRYLHRCGEPKGAADVATALNEPTSQSRYHLKALESFRTTREAGQGPGEGNSPLYESAVSEDVEILALLEGTETEDGDEDLKAP